MPSVTRPDMVFSLITVGRHRGLASGSILLTLMLQGRRHRRHHRRSIDPGCFPPYRHRTTSGQYREVGASRLVKTSMARLRLYTWQNWWWRPVPELDMLMR